MSDPINDSNHDAEAVEHAIPGGLSVSEGGSDTQKEAGRSFEEQPPNEAEDEQKGNSG